jgi:GTP-binding protein EngB required for normal cell division
VDIRHEPKANDKMMYDWVVSNGFKPILIATKSDKLSRSAIPKNIKIIREGLNAPKDAIIIPFSAASKAGREEIWELIEKITNGDAQTEGAVAE